MKKFRVVYWFNSIITERIVLAETEEEAALKFKDRKVISISIVK